MKKYFKEEKVKEKLLSDYLKEDFKHFESCFVKEEDRRKRTEYLISILGDVLITEDFYQLFLMQFQRFGGRYDVRTRRETIKDIYEITKKYPLLSKIAIDELWSSYIRDLFEEYQMTTILDKYIAIFGQEDEAFELFLDYVEKKAEQHQQIYIQESMQTLELEDEYSERFLTHVKSLINRQHYKYDEIRKYLPSSDLIKVDEQQIDDIAVKTRIYFGCCQPVSYTMFDILLGEKTLDMYPEEVKYYVSSGKEVQATFTKTDFLESIKKVQREKK